MGKAGSSKYKNLEKSLLWKAVDTGGGAGSFNGARFIVGEGGGFLPRPDKTEVYSASAVFDAEGSLLECSWMDFFYFEYLTEGQWKNREERSGNNARAFFDRENLTEAGKELVSGSAPSMHAAAMRFTGAFDGVSFIPQKIEPSTEMNFRMSYIPEEPDSVYCFRHYGGSWSSMAVHLRGSGRRGLCQ